MNIRPLCSTLFLVLGLTVAGAQPADAPPQGELMYPALPILPPTALQGDAGDGRAYLRWNLSIEDPRIVGWKVQGEGAPAEVLAEPVCVVTDLTNDTAHTFRVVGVLQDGATTPPSNAVTVTPRALKGEVKSEALPDRQIIEVGSHKRIEITKFGWRVVWPDGQELIYDNCRPIDWKTRDGQHLIYPKHFGNGVDIGQFDKRGLPLIIPPDGLKNEDLSNWRSGHYAPPVLPEGEYRDAQFGHKHPHITDPLTLPQGIENRDAPMMWNPPTVDGDRVTFEYFLPLSAGGYRAWTHVRVLETWWPIERDRHGAVYHGLARSIEVEMLGSFKHGYQVMLNNGFGPDGGKRERVTMYSSGFRGPGSEVLDFSGDKNVQEVLQNPKPPRRGTGYHPNQDCLQSHPLIFYDWMDGTLTITARSMYYHVARASATYTEQGADGVWPNLAWDIGEAGKRVAVDTIEYLYTASEQPLPQKFVNARMEALADVSARYTLQDRLVSFFQEQHLGEMQGKPVEYAKRYAEQRNKLPEWDAFGSSFHDSWQANPYLVDPRYLLDPDYKENAELKEMNKILREAGLNPGFWFRPELVKTSLPVVLSERIPQMAGYYHSHGVGNKQVPNPEPRMQAEGIPIVRENPHWIRKQSDGAWPARTPYQWVPMSLATGWWDQVMWPALVTSKAMGFNWVLQDGGFGGLGGVDYAPMLSGEVDHALPVQPYWWRMFRSMHHAGIDLIGECTTGWKGANVVLVHPGDEPFLWLNTATVIYENRIDTPQSTHRLYQLYNTNRNGAPEVRRYARKIYTQNGPPDWVELSNLRQQHEQEFTVNVGESPVAGGGTRTSDQKQIRYRVKPWIWDDVIWHYADGKTVTYPAYEKIDWTKE